jgi:malonyl CoA-acyl carrier protein transacylase
MVSPATIIVFPGQGSQRSAMGRDFHDNFLAARRVYEEASEALGLDLRALCFDDDPRLDPDVLRSTGERVLEIGPAAPLRGFFRTLGVAVEPITSVRALTRLTARAVA